MRDRIEKFVVMPFTIRTCSAHSSVAIKDHNLTTRRPLSKHKNTHGNIATSNRITPSHSHSKNSIRKVKEQAISQSGRIESSSTFMHTKFQISSKLHRLIKEGIKALSQLFVYKEEEEEEMQIGYPTDVKHVAHIGWDGSSSASAVKSWMDETKSGDERRRNSSSDIEQPRCSRWVDDPSTLPTWAAHDLLGSLGLHPSNKNASRFEFFNAADAKAERAESQMTSTNH